MRSQGNDTCCSVLFDLQVGHEMEQQILAALDKSILAPQGDVTMLRAPNPQEPPSSFWTLITAAICDCWLPSSSSLYLRFDPMVQLNASVHRSPNISSLLNLSFLFSNHSVLWMDHLFNLLQLPQHRPNPHSRHQQTLQRWLHSYRWACQDLCGMAIKREVELCQGFQFQALTRPLNILWWAASLSDYLQCEQNAAGAWANETKVNLENTTRFKQLIVDLFKWKDFYLAGKSALLSLFQQRCLPVTDAV